MTTISFDIQAEEIASQIHRTYERYAPAQHSRVLWSELPPENKSLMVAVVKKLLIDEIITPGSAVSSKEQIPN